MLGRYFGRRFLSAVAAVFFLCVGLIAIVDFFELTRRIGERPNTGIEDVAFLVLLRLPAFTEQMLPFAVLIGAMATFLSLSRRLELVVARTAGISVWQFSGSTLAFALLIGVGATTVYNPLSAALKERADRIEATLFRDRTSLFQPSADGIWVRQQSVDGQAIIQAQASADKGRVLTGVRAFSFDPQGHFVERVEARSARLEPGRWVLSQARVHAASSATQDYDTYFISTNLSPEQVQGSLASPESLSFWDLPAAIAMTERAGLKADQYRLKYQSLLARPLLMVAMVVIAAAVSLRVFRLGGIGKMVLSGVLAGFLLYICIKLAEELGENGILYPALAAWSPVVFGALMGCLVLLYREDG
jgi:lipopolysaccharide export system permease protein